jgi:chromosome partitioning protein
MNVISPVSQQPESDEDLIERYGFHLANELANHRLASFPPSATKEFRKLTPPEAVRYLGVTESYLRQMAFALNGPTEPGQSRRSYTLDDLAKLREAMEARSRTSGKYLPHRRSGEHLQCISIVNFKGGSAKTTTAANLSQYLALNGFRTLVIDLDPQASLTTLFGIAPEAAVGPNQSLYGAIRYDDERVPIVSIIRKTYIPGLDLVPGAMELMEFEHETPRAFVKGNGFALQRIAEALGIVQDEYDLVIIDCPPQLGYLTMAAMIAATSVLVTVHPQMLDVMSMSQFLIMLGALMRVIRKASRKGPLKYDWLRFLITRFEPSDMPQDQMASFLRMEFGEVVLKNATLKSTAISDAGLTSQTIYEVERSQFTRATYDRALESVNGVNDEILNLIRSAWKRA